MPLAAPVLTNRRFSKTLTRSATLARSSARLIALETGAIYTAKFWPESRMPESECGRRLSEGTTLPG